MNAQGRREELGGLVTRGVGWMLTSQGATQLLGFAASVVVARFLSPREVGLATEAIVFVALALVFVDAGFAAVIIQRPSLSEEDISTAFWAGIMLGIGLTVAGVGLSWPIARLYGQPRVQSLFAVLSLVFLVTAPGIVQGALMTRELQFRSLEIRTIIATTVSTATVMVLAVLGFGAWAIVAQSLTVASVSTVLLWRASWWRPQATFSFHHLKGMSRFAGHVFGTRSVAWGQMNLDNFLVGRFLGAAPLGAYSLAFSIALTPMNRVALPITQVFFPAFSRMRDPDRIAELWLRAVRMVALVVVPAMLGLAVVAPDFVLFAFGVKWRAAAPVLQILAPVGLLQALTALNNGILQSLARTRMLFRFTTAMAVVSVCSFAAGLPWGIRGVATGYLLATLVLQPVFVALTVRVVALSAWDWWRSIFGVLQAGAGMLVITFLARQLLIGEGVPAGWRLVAVAMLGAAVYAALVAWRAPQVRTELRAFRSGRRSASPAVPDAS